MDAATCTDHLLPAREPTGVRARPATIWMTGRRGSGRRTLARAVVAGFAVAGRPACIVDDDRVAASGTTAAELAMELAAMDVVAIVVAGSPSVGERERIRREHEQRRLTFVEVFVDTPAAVCAARGVADPGYEDPPLPDLVVRPGPLLPAVLSIVDLA